MGCNNSINQYEEGNTIMNRYDIKNIKVKAEGKDKKIQFESKFIKRWSQLTFIINGLQLN